MIKTLTLNPTLDRHLSLRKMELGTQNRAYAETVCAGGKGVNTARVLTVLGQEVLAVAAVGERGREEYLSRLKEDGVSVIPWTVWGQSVRTNLYLHPEEGEETAVSIDTFSVKENDLTEIFSLLSPQKGDLISVSGRMPNGLSQPTLQTFFESIRERGAFLCLDSGSFSLQETVLLKPWMIKPNQKEVQALGFPVSDTESALMAADRLHSSGISQVLLSLGGEGGVYSGEYGRYRILVPKLSSPKSTVGAGDSTIAGFLLGITEGKAIEDVLRLAFACGTAACLTEGTLPPRQEDVEKLIGEISVQKHQT